VKIKSYLYKKTLCSRKALLLCRFYIISKSKLWSDKTSRSSTYAFDKSIYSK